jgi:hypothetical protein
MIRVMTQREITQLDKDMDAWWQNLDPVTKSHIYHFVKDVLDSKDIKAATEKHQKKISQRAMRSHKRFQKQMEKQMRQ